MEDWKEFCKVLYTGNGKPFAVVRDDTIIEADSVDELIEAIRNDAKLSRGAMVWITYNGRRFPIKNGKLPNGKSYTPKVGSTINVSNKRGVVSYIVTSAGNFHATLITAKATISPRDAWRVDDTHSIADYKGDKLFRTGKGSTIAVTKDGDIISVAKNTKDIVSGSELLQFAVAQGGKKLDSFSGNYNFYVKNGFEPVSWTPFNKEYAPHDWNEKRDREEPVIFFKYTGKVTKMTEQEFYRKVKPCEGENGYDDAMTIRDKSMR